MSVVGARPQFVKLAAVADAFRSTTHRHTIVHTGQHYDAAMSDVFFADLEIPAPDVHLGVGSASHGKQTGAILAALDDVLLETEPDWVLVYGDTNSTLAGALSAAKLHVPVAHLEAGLRSFNRRMPEEHNRVLTDHCADLLLAPTQLAADNLGHEGLSARTVLVGDVMTDVLRRVRDSVRGAPNTLPGGMDADQPYVLATIHRAENTDDAARLRGIVAGLAGLEVPTVLLAHPRLRARADQFGIELAGDHLLVAEPLPYPALIRALMDSRALITDSGGLQKEAYLLGVPATTVRTETEWPETLVDGWNVLLTDLAQLPATALRAAPAVPPGRPYGDGRAAHRVISALEQFDGPAASSRTVPG